MKNVLLLLKRSVVGLLLLGAGAGLSARADQIIYNDALTNGWENWRWATVNYNSTAYVHSGTKAISVTGGGDTAVYWHHSAFNSSSFTNLSFWINGGASGGQLLQVQAQLNNVSQQAYQLPALLPNTWQHVSIPLGALGVANKPNLDGFWIQDRSGSSFSTFYVDDVSLLSGPIIPPGPVMVTIDPQRNRKPINPYIYGVAFASSNDLAAMNVPLNRSGGNATTRYNWQQNSFQTAFDWFFQSLPHESAIPGDEVDDFTDSTRDGGAEPIVTIPTIGWVADVTPARTKRWSFSMAKYGPQTETEFSRTGGAFWASPDAGNGISSATSKEIKNNDPTDANMAVTSSFMRGWIEHLTNQWNMASNGGLRFYTLDNEPSLWHSTHRDVFPTGATMEQVRDRMIGYGAMIKAVDPSAIIFGPEEWGWSGYFYSGFDQQYSATNNWNVFPDRAAHSNKDYLPWLLDQLRQTNKATGKRLLDVFTVHYYPQGGEFSTNVTSDMQQRRNRSTRSLWDPEYADESWISASVHLIPRLKAWVQTNYPGTQIGITEYSWGADDHINGATAQADILGIFGREGLDYATRWVSPEAGTPVFNAFKIYRNYDGLKSTFGDVSVFAQAPNPDEVTAFAAIRTNDAALTMMVVNKSLTASQPVTFQLTNFLSTGSASVWQLNSSNNITRLPNVTSISNNFTYTAPAQSITLFILPQPVPSAPRLEPNEVNGSNEFVFTLLGQAGFRYVVESSTALSGWIPVSTNLLSSNSVTIAVPAGDAAKFYRAVWRP